MACVLVDIKAPRNNGIPRRDEEAQYRAEMPPADFMPPPAVDARSSSSARPMRVTIRNRDTSSSPSLIARTADTLFEETGEILRTQVVRRGCGGGWRERTATG